MSDEAPEGRPLRADAQSNHDRLLTVAAQAFARDGAAASLRAIAQEAGVGIGTLYRRFPSRESLVEAVYRNEVAGLCRAADELIGEAAPLDALSAWMERFVDFMHAKHGMKDTLRGVLTSEDDRLRTRALLCDALATLMDAGIREGLVSSGPDPYDVLMTLGGITLIAEDRARALRMTDLLLNGLRARTPPLDSLVVVDGRDG
ncbi:TetR/AcrR family transcriptional regulator [Streptomyces fructofermentans]|uniref:TetR family transcriptional regulator n=1 Tax=Streptomyces fructofermentans TaxID=152141 RepID=A0A918NN31_9ACTN|nr:TetR/AcrR family transcriptional regulator [Streptomyces fructofermentans]GGX82457.1 TetR family transcriptional regulator [Streptomyces fructofermentans]